MLPARVRFNPTGFEAFGEDGRKLWSRSFPKEFVPAGMADTHRTFDDFVRVADLTGDGDREVLIAVELRLGPNPADRFTRDVQCFSSKGVHLWSYRPEARYQFGDRVMSGPWNVFDLMVSHASGRRSIWVTAAHEVWGNSIIVELDPVTGRGPVRFVNTGVIHVLSETRIQNRPFLLAGGFNNEYETGFLAVIDEGKPFGVSPQTAHTRHKCVSCPGGDPDLFFVFDRSEINILGREWLDHVWAIAPREGDIEVSKHEIIDRSGFDTWYLLRLTPSPQVISMRYSSTYDMEHRDLERGGRITHSLDQCPERLHPAPVRMWTPGMGWIKLPVKPH